MKCWVYMLCRLLDCLHSVTVVTIWQHSIGKKWGSSNSRGRREIGPQSKQGFHVKFCSRNRSQPRDFKQYSNSTNDLAVLPLHWHWKYLHFHKCDIHGKSQIGQTSKNVLLRLIRNQMPWALCNSKDWSPYVLTWSAARAAFWKYTSSCSTSL